MGPGERAATQSAEVPDNVKRMRAILATHGHVTWLQPGQAGVADHTATWIEASADPRIDGTPVTVSREMLGMLADYLEARFGR